MLFFLNEYVDLICHYLLILTVNGTTGEGVYSLTVDERMALTEAWVKEKSKVPTIIVQVGGCGLRDAQKLAKHAQDIGATAIAVLPSMFTFPSDVDELIEWISQIASAAPDLPCLYYHIPVFTKVTRKYFTKKILCIFELFHDDFEKIYVTR